MTRTHQWCRHAREHIVKYCASLWWCARCGAVWSGEVHESNGSRRWRRPQVSRERDNKGAAPVRAEKAEKERDALRNDAERWADVCRSVGRDTATDRAADDVSDAVAVLKAAGAPDLPIDEQCMWLVGQRDEERWQRQLEAELAREAIAHVRALIDAIEDEDQEKAHTEACAFLEKVRV